MLRYRSIFATCVSLKDLFSECCFLQPMSMAVVCANVSWLVPSATIASKTKSYNVASASSACLVFRPQRFGSQTRYSSLACRASSGGSRRHHEIFSRGRRIAEYVSTSLPSPLPCSRQNPNSNIAGVHSHMKRVTPSTPDLINTLESEKSDQAKLDSRLDGGNGDGDCDEYVEVESQEESEDFDNPDVRPA